MIVIVSHARFGEDKKPTYGTGSGLSSFLQDKDVSYFFIRHSLYDEFPSLVEKFFNGKRNRKFYGFKKLPFPLRFIQEQIINFYFIFKTRKSIDLFIGIDPLNAFSGVLAQKIGKVKKTIFYTADYAHKRFKNPIMNWFYHSIDRFVIKNVNQVWNVSTRITKLREKQGVPEVKNVFVPNSPDFKKIKRLPYQKINKHDLIIVSHLTQAINYILVFRVIKKLSQKYKDIRLLIIGSGPYEQKLKKQAERLNISDRILFLGRKSHYEVLKILSRAAIGIALYTEEYPWTRFGDSMKVREYLACGLPVIMTDIPSTADDVKQANAGYVINLDETELEKSIKELFSDKSKYLQIRRNAIGLARKFDISKILERLLK